ncbi:NGG1p interacting factor NIF3 [Salinibius halmophilus]|uniref:NGG1p interacting factor NIF3 n=1 Tax=Salinibius halmophilus TaxID=1853216 RepID=UPI000E6685FD|nr:NGG1p interacting factor NIF3 [Salinibius halmophilus]
MLQLVVYVPVTHKEQVKLALFEAGAGTQGDYEHCAFEYAGTGQFKPMASANPFIGEPGALERVEEVKVEMLCPEHLRNAVLQALKAAHPYEEPAYHFVRIEM